MTCDFFDLAAPGVRGLQPYQPGKPVEELQRELGLTDVIKLASNENPLGPSPEVINSLAAVKHLIYDSKQLTWERLLSALEDDFEGYQDVRQMCLSAPKYGNDIP
ncbi:MAG: hypothetical protein HQ497_15405, partial [SAR86 cluster bacterium]|nr:hypothetical protein [SAR86 cluster bacterium]